MENTNLDIKIDNEAFLTALQIAKDGVSSSGGIGTLSEKLLHKTLKLYFAPDENNHEIEYLGSVADVKSPDGIIEIQTRCFDKLLPKLKKFLPELPVTVVHPIIKEKSIAWLNKETGECENPRKSTRRGLPSDALFELSKIRDVLFNKNLTVILVFINATEYRMLDGWDTEHKRGATRLERIPTELVDIVRLKSSSDYVKLLPQGLSEEFYAKDFYRAARLRGRRASFSLKLLLDIGVVTRQKGEGRAYLYKRVLNLSE